MLDYCWMKTAKIALRCPTAMENLRAKGNLYEMARY